MKKHLKTKKNQTKKRVELGPLVVCKHCSKYTRTIETHLKYIHGIRTNISEHYCTIQEWQQMRVKKEQERQARERKRMDDPDYISCGTKIHNSQFVKIIYTPMGGRNKKY